MCNENNALNEVCNQIAVPNLLEKLKRLKCKTPEDVVKILEDKNKTEEMLKEYSFTPLMELAVQTVMKSAIESKQLNGFSKACSLRDHLPSNPNDVSREHQQIVCEERKMGKTLEEKVEEMEKKK